MILANPPTALNGWTVFGCVAKLSPQQRRDQIGAVLEAWIGACSKK